MTFTTHASGGTAVREAPNDHALKRARLLALLAAQDADTLVLTSAGALGWYLEGARVLVSLAGDPVATVIVTAEDDTVVVFANEAERLQAEELPAGITIVAVPWTAPLVGDRHRRGTPRVLHEADAAAELRAARASLLPTEATRYAALGAETAALMTRVLSDARPVSTEREIVAALAHAAIDSGADVLVALAAGRSRLGYRHPLPTGAPLGDLAMVVLCTRRHGLIVNLTRWVRFGAATTTEADAERRIREVEAAFFAATVPGASVGSTFEAGIAAYAAHGFDADEWRRHHQGGPCGYNGRDPRATGDVADTIVSGQAFAWNPTAPGVKVEDTVLLHDSGLRVLTADPAWPTVEVAGLARPVALEL